MELRIRRMVGQLSDRRPQPLPRTRGQKRQRADPGQVGVGESGGIESSPDQALEELDVSLRVQVGHQLLAQV